MSEPIHEPFASTPPSEMFERILTTSSGIVSQCEFCHRTFFEDNESAGDWDEGELEGLRKRAVAEPDRVIAMDHVARGTIAGKEGVFGCPCNWATAYEIFIWENRHVVMRFISDKVKDLVERALEDEGQAEQAEADLVQGDKALETVRCPRCLKFVSQIAMSEGGMCVKCWEIVERETKEAEEKRKLEAEAEKVEQERLEQERLDALTENLPF